MGVNLTIETMNMKNTPAIDRLSCFCPVDDLKAELREPSHIKAIVIPTDLRLALENWQSYWSTYLFRIGEASSFPHGPK